MARRKRVLFKEKYPQLLKFFTKPVELENIAIGDQRKFEVKCVKGHRKPILLKTLIKEKRVPCGYCSGRLVYKVSEEQKKISLGLIAGELDNLRNDLWFTHPQYAKQLVNPEEGFLVTPNSVKPLEFICSKKHVLKVKVNTKTSLNPDCGYCARKRLWPVSDEQLGYSIEGELGLIDPRRNDYLASHPEIIEFLVNPAEALVISSNTIVEVYCNKKLHKNFKALNKIHQCGYCDGKKIFELSKEDIDIILNGDNSHLFEKRNDLYKYYPEQSLLLEDVRQAFKVTRNQKIDLDCVCTKNHRWTVHSTAYIRSGCRQCSSFTYSAPKIKFSEKYSELLQYWDYENNKSSPFEISVKREDRFYWICARCDNSFERCVRNQFESVDKICKSCELKDAAELRRIATLNRIGRLSDKCPDLAKEYSDSNEVTLDRVHIKTYYRAKWECSTCSYNWLSLIEVRVNGGGKCPKCSGRVLIKGVNDLATLAPHLVKDWDEDYDPTEVKANSSKMARWRCSKCGHKWRTSIKNRFKGGNGCLECFKTSKRSKGHQSVSDFVESLGYSVINDARPFKNSRLEVDIFIPELSIGLEYNGDYWHSDRVTKSRWGVKAKEKHHEKLLKAEDSGIALAYIWESDWQNNQETIKESVKRLLEENIMDSILRKLSSIESESMVGDLKLDDRSPSDYVKPLRNLSEEQYVLFKERYLKGETPASIGEDLNFNIHNLYKLIRENNLVEERLRLGVDKNGGKTIPLHLYEDFKEDYLVLSKAALLEKYKISNVSLMKLATRLGLVSKTHYKSLKR